MPEEELNQAPATEEEAPAEFDADKLAAAIQEMLDAGASPEQVMEIVGQAVEEGSLPPEAMDIAKEILGADEEEGRRLFGLDE